jgi:hypothetical protein
VTKDELKKFVRVVYASYNQTLLLSDEAPTFEAWWLQLSDVPYDDGVERLRLWGLTEKYMPNPGNIKKAYIISRTENPPPTPQQFWAHLQTLQKQHNNGTTPNTPTKYQHPCVTETLKELGATALTLITNQDREQAYQTYQKHFNNWLIQQATVAETK